MHEIYRGKTHSFDGKLRNNMSSAFVYCQGKKPNRNILYTEKSIISTVEQNTWPIEPPSAQRPGVRWLLHETIIHLQQREYDR